jgi:hypothetical protein
MPDVVDLSPSPRSHIKTLMRIGYTLNSAVADVIDNSVTASAKNIVIFAPPGREQPFIRISDDGCGMSPSELTSNMRIGCKDPSDDRESGDLGRFGSGMKTASFSQARRLTVVSRAEGQPIAAARWDVDRIEKEDSWCLEVFGAEELSGIEGVDPRLLDSPGTQVIWDKLSFLGGDSHSRDDSVELDGKLASLRAYLALHFHRFMAGSGKRKFSVNGSLVKPVDPFMKGEPAYQEGPSAKLRCKGGFIEIRTHVLPHFKKMDPKRLAELGGAAGISQKQGLYIYREKRLIIAGGWQGIKQHSQLGALARVQVDVPSALDRAWSTDVKKASLQMPPRVRRELKKYLAVPVRKSRKVHTYKGKVEKETGFWKIVEDENDKSITYQIDTSNALLEQLVRGCGKEGRSLIVEYLKGLEAKLPVNHIYKSMSDRPQDLGQDEIDMQALEALLDDAAEN